MSMPTLLRPMALHGRTDCKATAALEYSLLAALVSGAVIAAVSTVGLDLSQTFLRLAALVDAATAAIAAH